jgi:hypothetical protein
VRWLSERFSVLGSANGRVEPGKIWMNNLQRSFAQVTFASKPVAVFETSADLALTSINFKVALLREVSHRPCPRPR